MVLQKGCVCVSLLAIFGLAILLSRDSNAAKPAADKKAFLCYWGTWSIYRPEGYTFNTDHLDPHLCTHIIYGFAGLNNVTSKIGSLDPWCDYGPDECEVMESGEVHCGGLSTLSKTVELKSVNPELKVLIGIGGWNQGSERYSIMSANLIRRQIFVQSVVDFITRFDLDGLDMDWEYPTKGEGAGPEDYVNFPFLLKDLRSAFDEAEESLGRYLYLTAGVAAGIETVKDAYNIPEMSKHLDYINVMAYEFKAYFANQSELIGHHSPLYPKEWETDGNKSLTASAAVQYYLDNGAPAEKLTLGVGTYGKTFLLEDPTQFDFYDHAAGPGTLQPISQGAIRKLCQSASGYRFYFDYDYTIPYATDGVMWVGHDDEYSVVEKVDYAEYKGLGGMMLWSIDTDDFHNFCGSWNPSVISSSIKRRMGFHANTNNAVLSTRRGR